MFDCGKLAPHRATHRRESFAIAVTAVALLALAACGSPAADSGNPSTPASAATSGDFGRMVTVGGGRSVYLECRGTGSPTVVLVSGTGGAADEWTDA
ncbi:MAG: hypothetical protein WAT65_09395, partial [Candidatus Nanopelagicales bacterium]